MITMVTGLAHAAEQPIIIVDCIVQNAKTDAHLIKYYNKNA